jgi:hypothetical protein
LNSSIRIEEDVARMESALQEPEAVAISSPGKKERFSDFVSFLFVDASLNSSRLSIPIAGVFRSAGDARARSPAALRDRVLTRQ